MASFLNRIVDEYRNANDPPAYIGDKTIVQCAIDAKKRQEEIDHKTRLFLHENDYILYMAKKQRKTTRGDLLKIQNELYFSKFKVDTTPEVIRVILRDEIEKFDVAAYEKRKGIKKRK